VGAGGSQAMSRSLLPVAMLLFISAGGCKVSRRWGEIS
jgi:hypothetical protein